MYIPDDKLNEICAFKLVSGEEILAKVVKMDNTRQTLIIDQPLMLAPGNGGATLMPATFLGDLKKPVILNTDTITLIAEPITQIKDKYAELTSNIILPKKSMLVGA